VEEIREFWVTVLLSSKLLVDHFALRWISDDMIYASITDQTL